MSVCCRCDAPAVWPPCRFVPDFVLVTAALRLHQRIQLRAAHAPVDGIHYHTTGITHTHLHTHLHTVYTRLHVTSLKCYINLAHFFYFHFLKNPHCTVWVMCVYWFLCQGSLFSHDLNRHLN